MPKKSKKLSNKYDELYNDWLDYLLTGFNILVGQFYLIVEEIAVQLRGRGSKVKLVEEFCEQHLSSETVVHVYGHSPSETIKSVLQKVVNGFELGIKLSLSTTVSNATEIVEALEEEETSGYLVIHNLDAAGFRFVLIILF